MTKQRLGHRVEEVPIVFTEREEGVSKMSGRIVAEALLWVAAWGLRERVRKLVFRARD